MSSISQLWKTILTDIYNKGHIHHKDDAEIKEVLNISGWIDNPLSEIAPNSNMLSKEQYIELLKEGSFNIEGYSIKNDALAEYVLALDDKEMIKGGDFVYTYPQRLIEYDTVTKMGDPLYYNQLEIIIERLKENKGSNRAVAVLYNPGLDRREEHIPCFNWMQALIRDNMLYLSIMFRSNDIYNAFPSNMYFISYIGLSLLEELRTVYPSLKFAGIYYQCSSAHYYTDVVTDEIIQDIIRGD